MLSVEGSSGSASTSPTATFEHPMSDTAEDAPAAPACGVLMKDVSEGLGAPPPVERGWSSASRRPRSPLVSGANCKISTSSRHGSVSARRKTSPSRVLKRVSVLKKGVALDWSGGDFCECRRV